MPAIRAGGCVQAAVRSSAVACARRSSRSSTAASRLDARESPRAGDVHFRYALDLAILVHVEHPAEAEAAVERVLRLRDQTRRVRVRVAAGVGVARRAREIELAVLERDDGRDLVAEPYTAIRADVALQNLLGNFDDLRLRLLEIPAVVPATRLGFVADYLEHRAVRPVHEIDDRVHGLDERARIVIRDLERHAAVVEPRVPLGDLELLRVRQPFARQPRLVVVAVALDDERIALPAADRVAHPR